MSWMDSPEYAAAVAMSAARSANNPVMQCRCGESVRASGDGNTYCGNGVHRFECRACGARWDSTRDWTDEDYNAWERSRWRAYHGTEPTETVVRYLRHEITWKEAEALDPDTFVTFVNAPRWKL